MNVDAIRNVVLILVALTLVVNAGVYIYGRYALKRAGQLLSTRPIAKGMMRSETRQLLATTIGAVLVTVTGSIRNNYLDTVIGVVPVWLFWIILVGYMAFYALVLTPAVTVFEQARVLLRAVHREEQVK